jgi:hypothetical protein
MKKVLVISLLTVLLISLLVSCVSTPTAAPAPAAGTDKGTAEPVEYEGSGKNSSMLTAMSLAKMDAVRKAVIDMIGVANEQANQGKLDEVLYSTKNPNAYILADTYETIRKEKVGDDYLFECRVAVNLKAVESTLKAHGLYGEAVSTTQETAQAASDSEGKTESAASIIEEVSSPGDVELSAEEKKFIARYVSDMTYMVYFNEETAEDPFSMKAAIGMANEYLLSNAMETIDLAQVEKLKKDQIMVYEEETGESISMLQWIAQKLNADVYIEIDGITSGETVGSKYYGQANITLKAYEASTGRLLGSQPWNSPKTISTASEESARINALQTSVYKAMPIVISQSKAFMAKALGNGIKYEVIIQNTSDSRLMSSFRRKLKRKVKEIETVNQSPEETKYYIYILGSIEDLVDEIYDVAETIPGLEGMDQLFLRGKSVTFDSGL